MKKHIILILLSFLLFNCTVVDVLDKKPPYQADLDGAITNAEKVELALVGVYANLPASAYGSRDIIVEGSFKAGVMRKPEWWKKGNAVWYYERFWPVLSGSGDNEWNYDYGVIKNANFLLSVIDGINDFEGNRKEEIIGELHFMKALVYNRLMLRFAEYWDMDSRYGIIIRSELPKFENIKLKRSSVAEGYKKILDELETAIDKCPKYSSCSQASVVAAKALKARVLFQMEKYEDCIKAVDEVLTYTDNGLADNYATLFTDYSATKEILFAKEYGASDAPDLDSRLTSLGAGKWGPSKTYADLLENDPRKKAIIGDSIVVDYHYGEEGKVYKNTTMKKMLNASNDLPLIFIRTAEMYLIKAEAIYRNGGSLADAYAPIEVLRNRAGADEAPHSTNEEFENTLCNEWLIEMSCENWHEYFVLRRFGRDRLLAMNETLKEAYDKAAKEGKAKEEQYINRIEYRRISAIPSDEINGNSVDQNPGY